ncbi:unnamed protein product [Leptosia nina]|uniref:Phosphatidylethanolamine N-methyltransferase n=1 Tax=Leptosia nina TaxID=320188 RepID=A0AAV1JAW2_9NEOP
MDMISTIDFCEATYKVSLFFVLLNPVFWNIVSRLEYYTHLLTKITNNPKVGCYVLAVTIFSLCLIRSHYFVEAMAKQSSSEILNNDFVKLFGIILMILGQILVVMSTYQLGIIGTYCGDYFGILMKKRVTEFPFNICNNPMYRGSTMSFLGYALLHAKPAGILTAYCVHMVYEIAIKVEEPFTMKIYSSQKQNGKH